MSDASGEFQLAPDPDVDWEGTSIATDAGVTATNALGMKAQPRIALMGTAGNLTLPDGSPNPNYDRWREEIVIPIAQEWGVGELAWNPVRANWDRSMAPREAFMIARSQVVAMNIATNAGSPAGIAEVCMAAAGAAIRGTKLVVCMNEAEPDTPAASTARARSLAISALDTLIRKFPFVTRVSTVQQLGQKASIDLVEYIKLREAGIVAYHEYTVPPREQPLNPGIYMYGTSGKDRMPAWINQVAGEILRYQQLTGKEVPIAHSWSKDWGEAAQAAEEEHKSNDAVHCVAITNETPSLGILAELGARIMTAYFSGQSLGIYVEEMDAPAKDAPDDVKAAYRTRILVLEHLAAILRDEPDAPFYIASSTTDLGIWGIGELNKQVQRLAHLPAPRPAEPATPQYA